jgi:hypothetical protein
MEDAAAPRFPKRVSFYFKCLKGGAEGDRTPDLCIANAALSQLSYRPNREAESSFCAESVNQKTARSYRFGILRASAFCVSRVGRPIADNAPVDPLTPRRRWLCCSRSRLGAPLLLRRPRPA